jgi:hypothetical protein
MSDAEESALEPKFKLPDRGDPLSKSAQKKKLKRELFEEAKKQKKAEKKRKRDELRACGSLPSTSVAEKPLDGPETAGHKKKKRKLHGKAEKFKATVLIDLSFDSLMFEKVCMSKTTCSLELA